MLGKGRRGVRMGKQRGLYLTSGLKHSFRKGKRKKEERKKEGEPFNDQSEIPSPPYLSDTVWLRTYIVRVPVETAWKHEGPGAHLYLAHMVTGFLKHLIALQQSETVLVTYGCLDEEVALWTSPHPGSGS